MSEYRVGLEDLCIGLHRKIDVKGKEDKGKQTNDKVKSESDTYRKESKE